MQAIADVVFDHVESKFAGSGAPRIEVWELPLWMASLRKLPPKQLWLFGDAQGYGRACEMDAVDAQFRQRHFERRIRLIVRFRDALLRNFDAKGGQFQRLFLRVGDV